MLVSLQLRAAHLLVIIFFVELDLFLPLFGFCGSVESEALSTSSFGVRVSLATIYPLMSNWSEISVYANVLFIQVTPIFYPPL